MKAKRDLISGQRRVQRLIAIPMTPTRPVTDVKTPEIQKLHPDMSSCTSFPQAVTIISVVRKIRKIASIGTDE